LRVLENPLDVPRRNPKAIPPAVLDQVATRRASGQAEPGEFALQARGVRKAYGELEVLKGVELNVRWGEVVSIIGPSGSGKTTLIRTMNGLESLDRGEITLQGQPFLRGSQEPQGALGHKVHMRGIVHVGMVFQGFNLFPHKTALENVMLAPVYYAHGGGEELRLLSLATSR